MESIDELKKELETVNSRVEQVLDIILEHFKEQDERIEELEEEIEDLKDDVSSSIVE